MASAPDMGALHPEMGPLPASHDRAAGAVPEAALRIETLRNRPDFLAAARARRKAGPAFLLQARERRDGTDCVRVGFTCSKKVGNAVARNRAKRRLREIARLVLPTQARPGWDYVLVGFRDKTAARPFTALTEDLGAALAVVHRGAAPR